MKFIILSFLIALFATKALSQSKQSMEPLDGEDSSEEQIEPESLQSTSSILKKQPSEHSIEISQGIFQRWIGSLDSGQIEMRGIQLKTNVPFSKGFSWNTGIAVDLIKHFADSRRPERPGTIKNEGQGVSVSLGSSYNFAGQSFVGIDFLRSEGALTDKSYSMNIMELSGSSKISFESFVINWQWIKITRILREDFTSDIDKLRRHRSSYGFTPLVAELSIGIKI
ncbi:MAG: hypothetical protein EOP06_04330 [Proteobacteria bacterium]|nr:MAG: hypothetical protein EOP06_04330 [Pseudomonadota bacterium]